MTEIPYIDKVYWEEVNIYLSQLLSPINGGIHYWNASNPKPTSLKLQDEGLTGWDVPSQTLQRWTGSSWLILTYGTEVLRPLIYAFLGDNGNGLNPLWLAPLVRSAFTNWNPTQLPQWILNAFNSIVDNIPLSVLVPLLNSWTPSSTSPVGSRIIQAGLAGGMTPDEFIALFNNWPHPIPSWIVNYMNALLANKSWSNSPGEASYNQLLPAFTEWFNGWLKNYIQSRFSLAEVGGTFTFQQIQGALDYWFNNHLKAYIDNGDNSAKQYMANLFASLEAIENKNYADIIAKLGSHTHSSSNVVPSTFTGYAAWPNTQANTTNSYNYPVLIGACITNRLDSVTITVHPYNFSQSVWGTYSARMKVVMLPSSSWADKSNVNNTPNNVSVSALLSATSNVFTISCTGVSTEYSIVTNFSQVSSDNAYFIYLIFERVYWPDKYINTPMTGIVSLFKSDNTQLRSTETTGPSTIANMRYHTFYGMYNGPGESTP